MAQLALGAVVLGGNVFGWTVQREAAFRLLDAFVEAGGTSIDTADTYPSWVPGRRGGESEEIIGEWAAARGNRHQLVLATKVAKWSERPGLSPANIRAALEGSLKRLRTDYIDLYYAHEDDPRVPQVEYLATFDELVREGKVRALGASNFEAGRLKSALEISRTNRLARFEYSQDHYNLVERSFEQTLLPTLRETGVVELPYWSLAKGFLTGKYRPDAAVESSRASAARTYLADPRNLKLLTLLDGLAAEHRVAVAAVALAWLRAQPGIGAPVASARTEQQLEPLFQAARLELSAREVEALSAATAPSAP
jgi:aryl-alcohol dehydrogenase-like predicted oxidoreductase